MLPGWVGLELGEAILDGGYGILPELVLVVELAQVGGVLALRVGDGCQQVHLFLHPHSESGLDLAHPGVYLAHFVVQVAYFCDEWLDGGLEELQRQRCALGDWRPWARSLVGWTFRFHVDRHWWS